MTKVNKRKKMKAKTGGGSSSLPGPLEVARANGAKVRVAPPVRLQRSHAFRACSRSPKAACLLKYDSILGTFDADVQFGEDPLNVGQVVNHRTTKVAIPHSIARLSDLGTFAVMGMVVDWYGVLVSRFLVLHFRVLWKREHHHVKISFFDE